MEETAKRDREDPGECPEAKRLRAADLTFLGILVDGDTPSPDLATGDIDNVMRSLEAEIAAPMPSHPPPHQLSKNGAKQTPSPPPMTTSDLCYLLEASDDDLGLPPTAPPFCDGGEASLGDLAGIGQIWGLADDIPDGALGLAGLGQVDDVAVGGGGGVLLDVDDVVTSWPSDFFDWPWRHESLSAV